MKENKKDGWQLAMTNKIINYVKYLTPLNKFKHRFFLEFVTKNFSRGLDAARDASRSRYIIPSLFLLGRSRGYPVRCVPRSRRTFDI